MSYFFKKLNNKKIILVFICGILLTAIIIGTGVYLFAKNSFNRQKQASENRAVSLENNIRMRDQYDSQNSKLINELREFKIEHAVTVDDMMPGVQKESLRRDSSIPLTPDAGYLITTSIVSNGGEKLVYAEISDCINRENIYEYSGPSCHWKYHIFIKNLKTAETNKIYSYPEEISFLQQLQKLLIKAAQAGRSGCPPLYFPLAWSKNDQKIIFNLGSPTDCGPGNTNPEYSIYTTDPDGKNLKGVAVRNAVFIDNYKKVIFTETSQKSPFWCGPSPRPMNDGKIVIKNMETEETVVLVEEPNSSYSELSVDDGPSLHYIVERVKDINGCSQSDSSVSKRNFGEIKIP